MTIEEKLDQLSDYEHQFELVTAEYEQKRKEIMSVVQAQLDELEAEFAPMKDTVGGKLEAIKDEIRTLVAAHGKTVSNGHYMAVYSKGRVSWDTTALDALASLIPQIEAARKAGDPIVSIRKVK